MIQRIDKNYKIYIAGHTGLVGSALWRRLEAGGYTRLGSPSKVSLRRLQNGQPVVFSLNAEQMSKDKKSKPFVILPDDIITVGERIF